MPTRRSCPESHAHKCSSCPPGDLALSRESLFQEVVRINAVVFTNAFQEGMLFKGLQVLPAITALRGIMDTHRGRFSGSLAH
eukprot:scaffold85780_cov18-Tisochrysis_lutea.AAC.1